MHILKHVNSLVEYRSLSWPTTNFFLSEPQSLAIMNWIYSTLPSDFKVSCTVEHIMIYELKYLSVQIFTFALKKQNSNKD